MILYAFIAAIIIMITSLSGIVFSYHRLGNWMEKNLGILITFSIGVFIVVTWGLLGEAFEHTDVLITLLSIVGGILFIKIASHIIPDAHHHHDIKTEHSHSKIDARHILLGDAVHNITDGLLLVPAFLAGTHIGIITTVGIFLHELVQEISEFFILKQTGYSTKQALIRNFIVSGTILVGVIIAFFISSIEKLEAPLIAFAAGGFLYIIFRDLIPSTIETIKRSQKNHIHIGAFIVGIALMVGINSLVPHSHGLEDDNHESTSVLIK
jgi:zinc and cadmium transporter